MIKINIEELLNKEKKSKYWLCKQMRITNRNLNNIINSKTTSISLRYIEEFCFYLNCKPDELFVINFEESYDYEK